MNVPPMTPDLAKAAHTLLQRVELRGNEVPAYVRVVQYLEQVIYSAEQPPTPQTHTPPQAVEPAPDPAPVSPNAVQPLRRPA